MTSRHRDLGAFAKEAGHEMTGGEGTVPAAAGPKGQQPRHQPAFWRHEGETKVWGIVEVRVMVKGRESFNRNLSSQTMSTL